MKNPDNTQNDKLSDVLSGYVAEAQEAKQRGDWKLALSLWNKCIQEYKHKNQMYWRAEYANALMELGRYEKAGQKFEALILDSPDFDGGYIGLARLAQKRCDWELALSSWDTCIQRFDNGDHPWWYANYAQALNGLNRFGEAEEIYKKLTIDFPDFGSGYAGLASVAQKQQDWEQAASLWKSCIQRFDTNNAWWLRAYAHALIELGRIEQAEEIAKQIKGPGKEQHTLDLLAKISWLAHDMVQCLHYAGQLIEYFPQVPRGYYWSEQVLIKLGRFDEAADVHVAWPGDGKDSQQQILLPDNYPADLILPPLIGAGNDYSFIEEKRKAFQESGGQLILPVSIVVPVYNRADMLAKTLAGLVHQTYPHELIEVIVADDGSSDHIAAVVQKYQKYLNLRYVRQEDRGYRLSAVRNLGMRAASHGHIILQDGDVIPARELVETYMHFFHVTDQAVLFGLRSYVCADEFDDDDLLNHPELIGHLPTVTPVNSVTDWQTVDGRSFDWRLPILAQTNNLKESIFPCQLFSAGIVAFPKAVLQLVGDFDEDFKDWGGEDTEFGYRLYNQGYYFIPMSEVISFHQEPSIEKGDYQVDREAGLKRSKPILQQKCPLPSIRNDLLDGPYHVPKVSIYIPAYNVGRYIKESVDSVLSQTFTDLEVVICDDGSTDNTLQVLETHFIDNPQVHWISQIHQGIAAASNSAIGNCRGMYIGQLDGDDMLEPQAVEVMADFLNNNDVGVVYSRYSLVDRTGELMRPIASVEFSRERLLTAMICTAFRMFRKRDWLRTDGFDESMVNAVDYDMMLKLSEVCNIEYLPRLTYKYRYHGQNTSLLNRDMQEQNHVLAINKSLARMGLSDQWEVIPGSEVNRRKVRFLHN